MIVHHHYSQNSVVTILKKFRHIIELALNREWIYKNPFSEYKLRWQKTDRGYLTQSEIESLIHCECEDSRLEQTRDVFIFCCFTGLAYTDIKHLTYGHIQSSVDGNLWLRGKRKKTDIEYNIPLLNIPKTILEKYRGFAENDLVLPVGCLPIYNRHLKELAKLCNINKTITSHLARHTFATLTLTKGVSIESVSKMLGHTNIQTTQIYAKITAKKISNEMNAFAEKINEMGMTSDVSL